MKKISIDGIDVTIIKSKRKTIAIKIKDQQVFVHMPSMLPILFAKRFVKQKANWIHKKLAETKPALPAKHYQDDELFSFLGQQYPLKLTETNQAVVITLQNEHIQLHGRIKRLSANGIKKQLTHWYQQQAADYLLERTHILANSTGLEPKSITIKTYKARWGSCTIKGDIQLNWKLMMAPPAVIDYVIIHELCHLQQHNHSTAFWDLVEQFEPNYKTHRLWLKKNGLQLHV